MSGRVLAPFTRRRLRVLAREAHGAYVVLRVADPAGPPPAPGQFYMLSTVGGWGGGQDGRPFLPRALSVLRHVAGELHFMLEDVGPGTHRLCAAAPGEELLVLGPLGNGFTAAPSGVTPVLVGGGVGVAPLAILQDSLLRGSGGCTSPPDPGLPGARPRVLLGFRDRAHGAGAALLDDAEVSTDDGSQGHHGQVTDLLAARLDELPAALVYACGPPAMLEAVRALCTARDVPAQLALESGMACGYGACFGCAVQTREGLVRLCLDGPVLTAASLTGVTVP